MQDDIKSGRPGKPPIVVLMVVAPVHWGDQSRCDHREFPSVSGEWGHPVNLPRPPHQQEPQRRLVTHSGPLHGDPSGRRTPMLRSECRFDNRVSREQARFVIVGRTDRRSPGATGNGNEARRGIRLRRLVPGSTMGSDFSRRPSDHSKSVPAQPQRATPSEVFVASI